MAAQDSLDYTPLAERLADYARLAMARDVDGLLDLTDPALFEVIPRRFLRDHLTVAAADDRLSVRVTDYTIDSIGKLIDHEGATYAPVRCHHRLTYRLLQSDAELRRRLARMLEKRYGPASRRPSDHPAELAAEVATALLAVRRGTGDWYFVEYRPENGALLDLVLPEAVRERMGE